MSCADQPEEGADRRIGVGLFIVHPTMTPLEISEALGLESAFSHRAGDPRKTPKGILIGGHYPDTRWRHSIRHELGDQHFVDKMTMLIERLVPHKAFLNQVRSAVARKLFLKN
jgi:hypothetical protein